MVKFRIEVRNGAARFHVAVHTENIRQAVMIRGRRYPGGDVRFSFPIDPEGFFARDTAARAETAA